MNTKLLLQVKAAILAEPSTLKRKTPLNNGGKLRKTKLRPVSKKRAKLFPSRKAACEAVAQRSQGKCECGGLSCCTGHGEEFHEILARSQGGSPYDPANILHLSRVCHRYCTEVNPNDARKRGLIAPRGA